MESEWRRRGPEDSAFRMTTESRAVFSSLAAPCGLWVLGPRQGIDPGPSAMKAWSPNP